MRYSLDFGRGGEAAVDDVPTVERVVRVPTAAVIPVHARPTLRVPCVDERLLAISRGEIEPDAAPSPQSPYDTFHDGQPDEWDLEIELSLEDLI